MRNQEKAHVLALEIAQKYDSKEVTGYEAAMKMAEWKDSQYEEEKKKLVEKMSKWILENINKPFSNGGYISYVPPKGLHEDIEVYCAATRFIEDLKKIMEGE